MQSSALTNKTKIKINCLRRIRDQFNSNWILLFTVYFSGFYVSSWNYKLYMLLWKYLMNLLKIKKYIFFTQRIAMADRISKRND